MSVVSVLLYVIGLFCIVATLLPLARRDAWWIRVFDYPRVQIVVLSVAAIGTLYFVVPPSGPWENGILVVWVGAMLYQGIRIWPYTALAPNQVVRAKTPSSASTLKVMVANVLIDNREAEAFLDLVEHFAPDVVLTVETDAWWEEELRVLDEAYPFTVKQPQDNTYGMLLHSRLPIVDPEVRFLINDAIPSIHTQLRLPSGQQVWFHGLHPDPPNPRYATETTERDAELLVVGRHVADRDEPTIIAGDFNDVAWSYTTRLFQKVSGLLDPRRGRGMFSTFHADHRWLRWPLDHVFHSSHFKLVSINSGPAWGSDHLPIILTLTLDSEAQYVQEEPEATDEEEAEAEEKIEAAGGSVDTPML